MMPPYIIQSRSVGSRLEGKRQSRILLFPMICDYTLQRVGRHERRFCYSKHFVGAWEPEFLFSHSDTIIKEVHLA